MTRINILPMPSLSDQLLLSALGEEPRVMGNVIDRIDRGMPFDDIPMSFRLGTGHMRFFDDKCGYIFLRYMEMRGEYYSRFGNEYSKDHLEMVKSRYIYILDRIPALCGMWAPSDIDMELVVERITGKRYVRQHTYRGRPIIDYSLFIKNGYEKKKSKTPFG